MSNDTDDYEDPLAPLNFEPDEWELVLSGADGGPVYEHCDGELVITPEFYRKLEDQSRTIAEADVIPLDRVRQMVEYFDQRSDHNERKEDISASPIYGGIATGRQRSAEDLADLIEKQEDKNGSQLQET